MARVRRRRRNRSAVLGAQLADGFGSYAAHVLFFCLVDVARRRACSTSGSSRSSSIAIRSSCSVRLIWRRRTGSTWARSRSRRSLGQRSLAAAPHSAAAHRAAPVHQRADAALLGNRDMVDSDAASSSASGATSYRRFPLRTTRCIGARCSRLECTPRARSASPPWSTLHSSRLCRAHSCSCRSLHGR